MGSREVGAAQLGTTTLLDSLSLNRSAALRCGSLDNYRFAPHRSAALRLRGKGV
jgi:hypothetical protein